MGRARDIALWTVFNAAQQSKKKEEVQEPQLNQTMSEVNAPNEQGEASSYFVDVTSGSTKKRRPTMFGNEGSLLGN